MTKLGYSFRHLLSSLEQRPIFVSLLLVTIYSIARIPDVLVLKTFTNAVFPLNALYIADSVLFPAGRLNPDLATTVIAPSNASLILPPGLYMVCWLLGSVRNIFIFLFIIQLLVPLLVFRLLCSISSLLVATVAGVFSIYYWTNSNWLAPDFLIQPLMLGAVLLLLSDRQEEMWKDSIRLIMIGLLAGIILILKHNVGVFFVMTCLTHLFVDSLVLNGKGSSKYDHIFIYLILGAFFGFGYVVFEKLIYADEVIFYLIPYFGFWCLVMFVLIKNKSLVLNDTALLRKCLVFIAVPALLFGVCFLWIGGVVGYSRYWHSLFGMGLQYLPIWDKGIIETIGNYVQFNNQLTVKNAYVTYRSFLYVLMFVFPLVANCFAVGMIFKRMRDGVTNWIDIRKDIAVASLGIVGVFMLFPLEGFHILSTKLVLPLFVFVYFSRYLPQVASTRLKYLGFLAASPVVLLVVAKPLEVYGIENGQGSEVVQRVIGIPVEKHILSELEKQLVVVQRSIGGHHYYVLDTSGTTLTALLAFANNHHPQYYLEMRKGILDGEVAEAITASLSSAPFIVINSDDYNAYLRHVSYDPNMQRIMEFVEENYVEVDRYEAPKDPAPTFSHILSFLVMKNKREI